MRCLVVVLLSAAAAFCAAMLLGNALGNKARESSAEAFPAAAGTQLLTVPETTAKRSVPVSAGTVGYIELSRASSPEAAAKAAEELQKSGTASVGIPLTDADGAPLFASSAHTAGSQGTEGYDLAAVAEAITAKGVKVCGIFRSQSLSSSATGADKELAAAYERALFGEIAEAGLSELLLLPADGSLDVSAAVSAAGAAVALLENTAVGIAATPDTVSGDGAALAMSSLYGCCDFVALDVSGYVSEGALAQLPGLFTQASVCFSRYDMRLVYDCPSDTLEAVLLGFCEENAVKNIQKTAVTGDEK